MDELQKKIIEMIVVRCRLSDVDVDSVDCDAPLFFSDEEVVENSLELDSIDALELLAGLKECFNIVVESADMNVFYSVNTIAAYVRANTPVEV